MGVGLGGGCVPGVWSRAQRPFISLAQTEGWRGDVQCDHQQCELHVNNSEVRESEL